MRLLERRRRRPQAKTIRPAERYLAAGAEEARRLGSGFVGTEHVLLALTRDRSGCAALESLGVDPLAVEPALAPWLTPGPERAKIDPEALASLGIDLELVRARLEATFGPGALERTSPSCLGVEPQLKRALGHALGVAGAAPLTDEHMLLGMLSVPGSVAARVLSGLGPSGHDDRGAA